MGIRYRIKKKLKRKSPRWLNRLMRGLYVRPENRETCRRLRAEIKSAPGTAATKGILREMSTFGSRYEDIIHEICTCSVTPLRRRAERPRTAEDVTVVCVVKNEMQRLPLFLSYYREALGVKAFAFLDDGSDDGTREFLAAQEDVSLYASDAGYTTLRRVAWINRILEAEGLNRWYLIVDADEFFDYPGRDTQKIDRLTRFLSAHGQSRVNALMVDLFADDALFSQRLEGESALFSVYNRFFADYAYETATSIKGGGRLALFRAAGIETSGPCVTKYPLIRVDKYDCVINAHQYYPRERNLPIAPNTVLRHYKFLPSDRRRYLERIQKGNFYQNSLEYRAYMRVESGADYAAFIRQTERYDGYDSLFAIPVLNDLCFDGERFSQSPRRL